MNTSEYTISADVLQDLVASKLYPSAWQAMVKERYPDTLVNHEVVGKFQHFMLWPNSLFFYVKDGIVCREAIPAKSRIATMESFNQFFNEKRWALLTVDMPPGKWRISNSLCRI